MQFEKIRTINKRKIIMGGLISLGVISALIYLPSRAKYRTTDSFNIVNGTINYKVPDFNIVAMYSSEDGSNYTELTERMPDNGYTINESKSYCNLNGIKDTNAILKTINGNHVISNLIKGDKCYLYFDKYTPAEDTLAKLGITNPKEPTANMFASIATDEGVFKIDDPIYEGTSYYYRGAVTNNYVKFANLCWRIIRINGDGSVRLIYDGTTCHANGTTGEVAIASQKYSLNYNNSSYVGWTYTVGSQRTLSGTSSNAKIQTENWYNSNIGNYTEWNSKVDNGKFCNDRRTQNNEIWRANGSTDQYYAAYKRMIMDYMPSLDCDLGDIYTLKVGAITVDEVSLAGGVARVANNTYYLYNGKSYWTMSPIHWYGFNGIARVFVVNYDGKLDNGDMYCVDNPRDLRPVINLKVDTVFSSGDGTIDTPFTVQ